MSLVWATGILTLSLPFLLWPLLRHQEPAPETPGVAEAAERQAALLAIEEVELDAASGRLDAHEAARRLAELKANAELVLRRR